jgi:ATP-binding cassette subfamily B protein
MSAYFETEAVVKEYDSKILKRILQYVMKYKALVFFTALALVVSTLGELLVPVLQQRLIDDAILIRFIKIDRTKIENAKAGFSDKTKIELDKALKNTHVIKIGDLLFLREGSELMLSGAIKKELENASILDGEQWYAFYITGDSDGDQSDSTIIKSHPEYFISSGTSAAIKTSDLLKLTLEEKKVLRKADIKMIFWVTVLLLFVLLIVFLATFVQIFTASLAGQKVMKDMRIELFKNTSSLSTGFLSLNPVGRLVTRLTGDVETINEFFTSVIVALLKDVSLMIGVLLTLFYLSPHLALVVVVCLPPVVIATITSRSRARDAFRRQRVASSSINSYLSERLSLLSVVQLFRREKKSQNEYKERNTELLNANIDEMFVFATFRPIVEFLAILTTAAVIAVGANLVLNLSLSLGVLIAFINLVAMFYAPVMDISEKYTILQSAMAGGERVFNLLDTNEKINDSAEPYTKEIEGDIEFKNVTFSYKKNEPVIKDLSFSVKRGERIAIVGYTGAGKTTITNILARLWDVDGGEITLDGHNIKDMPLNTLRRAVLPVLQDVFLFSGTISENISLGLPLSDAEIQAAAKAVYADKFIEKLPNGYNTLLSEGAVNISSGEKQLISFARVIAHNPKVVVLDEATSSIDSETEHLLQIGMKNVLAGRTSIVIAHRLSTIKNSDRILVLSNGTLAEQGTHKTLIENGGLYSLLCKLQFENIV